MTQLVKCLPYKFEDLSLTPRIYTKSVTDAGQVETSVFWSTW